MSEKRSFVTEFYHNLSEEDVTFWHVLWAVTVVGFFGLILTAALAAMVAVVVLIILEVPAIGITLALFIVGVLIVSMLVWMRSEK